MTKIILLCCSVFLVGCSTCQPRIETVEVNIPVWTPPKVTLPARPVLDNMDNAVSDGEIVRAAVVNQISIQQYAKELENIVHTLLKAPK